MDPCYWRSSRPTRRDRRSSVASFVPVSPVTRPRDETRARSAEIIRSMTITRRRQREDLREIFRTTTTTTRDYFLDFFPTRSSDGTRLSRILRDRRERARDDDDDDDDDDDGRTHMDQTAFTRMRCRLASRREMNLRAGVADRRMRPAFAASRGADGLRADRFYLTRSSTDWLRCNGAGMLSLSSGQLPRSPRPHGDTIFEGVVTGDPIVRQQENPRNSLSLSLSLSLSFPLAETSQHHRAASRETDVRSVDS